MSSKLPRDSQRSNGGGRSESHIPPALRYLPSLTIGPVCLQTWKPGGGTQAIISLPAATHAGAPAADRILERATVRALIGPSLFTAVVFQTSPLQPPESRC